LRRFLGKESAQPLPIMMNEILLEEEMSPAKIGKYQELAVSATVDAAVDRAVLMLWLAEKVMPEFKELNVTISDIRIVTQ
jgi:hypothetical protein